MNGRNGRILMGGMQEKMLEFDLTTAKETKVESLHPGGSCAILRDHSRFICCGDAMGGKVHLRDPISLKSKSKQCTVSESISALVDVDRMFLVFPVVHTLDAHSGLLSDFDVHGNHLVTCGQSMRQGAGGITQPDRFLMVYDLRVRRKRPFVRSCRNTVYSIPHHFWSCF